MNKLNKLYLKSKRILIDDKSKIVIMSDCHRGTGDSFDNFIHNQNIFNAALIHYYNNGFSYIELGDGDEMWETNNYKDIVREHIDTFRLLKKFHDDNRFYMIYGNHDILKKYKKTLQDNFYTYYNKATRVNEELLNNLQVYESLILDYKNHDIFLIHGHQVDFFSGTLWRLARFLVRHIWRHLERLGIKDPTSAAKNYNETKRIEKRLKKWSIRNKKIVISGHTHRPIFPTLGESLYFNAGSCIHPNGITALEIENGNITLVKWMFRLEDDKIISVGRVVVEESTPIINYFLY